MVPRMTTEFLGRNELFQRLTAQVGSADLAKSILIGRGHMFADGTLTQEGQRRNAMTAEERAKDRAIKRTGGRTRDYAYNPVTNRVRKLLGPAGLKGVKPL
jgi:hypothetical protein